jgi:hypothetical protein
MGCDAGREKRGMSELRAIFRAGAVGGEIPSAWESLAHEFPNVAIRRGPESCGQGPPCLPVSREEWESNFFNFYDFDGKVDAMAERGRGPFTLSIQGAPEELPRAAAGILTRCQRWTDRRNRVSRSPLFDRILTEHRDLHDLSKPLVRADYGHALDTWQWTLRLAPDADLAVQLAALFHDVERLSSEADTRVEHHAADYQAFKDDHAERGAELADAILGWVGADGGTRAKTARLIAAHEHPPEPGDPDFQALALLNDADALSFFSLNSVGYLDYFGPEATARKVAYTLRRLRPESRRHLDGLRLRPALTEALEKAA